MRLSSVFCVDNFPANNWQLSEVFVQQFHEQYLCKIIKLVKPLYKAKWNEYQHVCYGTIKISDSLRANSPLDAGVSVPSVCLLDWLFETLYDWEFAASSA